MAHERGSGRRTNITEILQHAHNTKHARNQKHLPPPLPAHQRTCCGTPSEQSHVPDRCSCKINARHAELSHRPCPSCTVVHIHNFRINITCSSAHERGIGSRANRTVIPQQGQTENTQATTNNFFSPHLPVHQAHFVCNPQRTKPRSRQMQLQADSAPG